MVMRVTLVLILSVAHVGYVYLLSLVAKTGLTLFLMATTGLILFFAVGLVSKILSVAVGVVFGVQACVAAFFPNNVIRR